MKGKLIGIIKQRLIFFFTALTCIGTILGAEALQVGEVSVQWSYQSAANGQNFSSQQSLAIPPFDYSSRIPVTTDPVVKKAVFLTQVGKKLKGAIEQYETICRGDFNGPFAADLPEPPRLASEFHSVHSVAPVAQSVGLFSPMPPIVMPPPPTMPHPIMPPPPPPNNNCLQKRKVLGSQLKAAVESLRTEALGEQLLKADPKVLELLDLGLKLASNMQEGRPPSVPNPTPPPMPRPPMTPGPGPGPAPMPPPPMPAPAPGPGNGGGQLVGGGAKDMEYVRKLILEGRVPHKENLTIEGLLAEFDFPLTLASCTQLVCVQPAVLVEPNQRKLWVEVAMNSSISSENFKRPALNLSLIIDVSGSMAANDGTVRSRLEWVKEAAIHAVSELEEGDLLNIVIFDTHAEILLSPTPVVRREEIIQKIKSLETRNSTNLEEGLRVGLELLEASASPKRASRAILLTDAGLNTGVTDKSIIERLVNRFAANNIGLTAVGIGDNFEQDLIHNISRLRGGNYIFVESGRRLAEYFNGFDFLVSPIAYSFKADLKINGLKSRLAAAYGIPGKFGDQAVVKLIELETLFFAGPAGGGTILLEYDLIAVE